MLCKQSTQIPAANNRSKKSKSFIWSLDRRGPTIENQCDNKENEKNKKQQLCRVSGNFSDTTKTKNSGNDRNNQK